MALTNKFSEALYIVDIDALTNLSLEYKRLYSLYLNHTRQFQMDPDQLRYIHHKPLSITDINEKLALPVRLIDYIWGPNDPREREFRVIDRFGEGWDFRAHMRWDQHGHQKPEVYGSEWRRFVRMKELRAGDELFFYQHPHPAPPGVIFVLSIKRSIQLLGNIVTGHIAI